MTTTPPPLVARFNPHETRSKRVVLFARVAGPIPAGTYVALVDVSGELFLKVVESDDPDLLTAKQVHERVQR